MRLGSYGALALGQQGDALERAPTGLVGAKITGRPHMPCGGSAAPTNRRNGHPTERSCSSRACYAQRCRLVSSQLSAFAEPWPWLSSLLWLYFAPLLCVRAVWL